MHIVSFFRKDFQDFQLFNRYGVGGRLVREKICDKYEKLGGWLGDTRKNLQKLSKIGWVGRFDVLAVFFSVRSAIFS